MYAEARVSEEAPVLELVSACYGAALEPERWVEMVQMLTGLLDGRQSGLVLIDKIEHRLSLAVTSDGAIAASADAPVDAPVIDRRLMSGLDFDAGTVFMYRTDSRSNGVISTCLSEFFAERGEGQFLGLVVRNDARDFAGLFVVREESGAKFGHREQRLLQSVAPHVDRALTLGNRLGRAERERHAILSALDRLAAGVVVVDREGQVQLTNSRAEQILADEDGLSADPGGLRAASQDDTKTLRQAIRVAAQAGNSANAEFATVMAIARPSLRRPLELLVAPQNSGRKNADAAGDAVVFVIDPEKRPQLVSDALVDLYGLSKAEAALAAALVAGKSLAQYSEERRRNIETARKTLKRIFAKTDTRRQADLVRRLLSGPAVFLSRT